MAIDFSITSSVLSNGRTAYSGQRLNSSEPKFIIGYRTHFQDNYGLFNTTVAADQVYNPEDYKNEHGFWSYFIYPTAMAESKGSFKCLNTYDRAKFTFGFMQFAAHVPNGDFVHFFKKLLQLPNAKDYFPKLVLQNDRIFYKYSNGTLSQLEDDTSTQALMDYLNPTLKDVENQEQICSARFVHWASNDSEHRKIQTETSLNLFKKNMKNYHERFGLHNAPAKVCLMICDIRHQGRGKNDRIAAALNTNGDYEKAYSNLCTIGDTNYKTRITTVKNNIAKLTADGLFSMKYDAGSGEFVSI
ncbi:hypothetical protein FEDK69T_28080 [Flavobacterium enshiense DK69]|uniref:Uncharacterized protein n=1 Tax=Flavobacterium enshiense DK69 TaxID=1107311 RepID=V6S7D1_9FLAO|nr:hypothetical protein [Flavobacterium enshiense]ESU20295.1 hypothetical protein FEDK69T_28080 [Flavobacterium enshiense DK69]KGO95893.1 hypothetical protein Q767_09430 [Flavobacterium enshiense DK69]